MSHERANGNQGAWRDAISFVHGNAPRCCPSAVMEKLFLSASRERNYTERKFSHNTLAVVIIAETFQSSFRLAHYQVTQATPVPIDPIIWGDDHPM